MSREIARSEVGPRATERPQRGLRVWALRSLIASITASALVGIYILMAGKFGQLEGRVLLTALAVSALSILAMACGAAFERRSLGVLPQVGVVVSVASFVLFMLAIWVTFDEEWIWQSAATLALAGTACAHACLISLPTLAVRFRWVRLLGWASAFALSGLFTALIWDHSWADTDAMGRLIGSLAILVAATTVAVPVLARMSGGAAAPVGRDLVRYCVACGQEVDGAVATTLRCARCGAEFRVEFGPRGQEPEATAR